MQYHSRTFCPTTAFFNILIFIVTLHLSACDRRQTNSDTPVESKPLASESANLVAEDKSEDLPPPSEKPVKLRKDSLPYITVQEVTPESLGGVISAPARVDFRTKAISTAGTIVAGRITHIFVQVGDRIKAGTPLATLASGEAAQIRSDFMRAETELARAEDRYRRQLEMQRTGVGLDVERVESETQVKQAQTEVERTRDVVRLLGSGVADEVTIRAPIDSMVLKAYVSVGAAVGTGAPLFDLGEPSAAWIVADVFESDLPLVQHGAKATIELASLNDPIHGHVVAESAAIQSDVRRASVFIEPDDSKINLRPGMYARAKIETTGPSRIVLPTSAILVKGSNETIVYIQTSPGVFESRKVQVGESREGMTPILKGLSGGEHVVIEGALLIDGEAAMLL